MRTVKPTSGLALLALIGAALPAAPARAQSPPVEAPDEVTSGPQIESEHEWYGPSVLAVYGAGYGAVGLGWLGRQTRYDALRVGGTVLQGAGALTMLIVVPALHWQHDEVGKGFISLGGQVGSAALGGVIGRAASDGDTEWMLLGAAIGHACFALGDGFLLARRERVISVETTATARLELVPMGLGAWLRLSH